MVELSGEKVDVAPVGKPVAEKVTLPVNPFVGVTLIVVLPVAPGATVSVAGDADSVKFAVPVPVTVRLIEADAVSAPDVPVTVIVLVPTVAVEFADKLRMEDVVELVGVKVSVTPVGRPDTLKVTVPVNPFNGLTVIVLVCAVPA